MDVFCQKCRGNQQKYIEALSNYLPDDDHPEYAKFEAGIPAAKADLERRYPQVCKNCASRAQERIHDADYYGKTQHAATMMKITSDMRSSGSSLLGRRDDWFKWTMRLLLRLVGMVVYASLLAQVAWHVYGISATIAATSATTEDLDTPAFTFDPTLRECVQQSRRIHFDTSCYQLFGALLPNALFASFCLMWYNHGIKAWYHHTLRIEAVHGRMEHFRIQSILLIIRTVGWYKLSDASVTNSFTKQQVLAAHGFAVFSMVLCQWVSERAISTSTWRLKGKIMPLPEEEDILGATAGTPIEQYNRQASSVPPQVRLFKTNDQPFPIEKLAPKRGYSRLDHHALYPPSSPESDDVSEDGMDIDEPSVNQERPAQPRSVYNYGMTQPTGWGAMRGELFGIQDNQRASDEKKRQQAEDRAKLRYEPPQEQSPFRGRLPQAPMSMERRLRNPPTQVSFKKQDVSKQQDFMRQMREGIQNGKRFNKPSTSRQEASSAAKADRDPFAFDDDFSPVKNGRMDLHDSGWRLPSDVAKATGLEDLFSGNSFRIAEVDERARPTAERFSMRLVWVLISIAVALAAVAWNFRYLRTFEL